MIKVFRPVNISNTPLSGYPTLFQHSAVGGHTEYRPTAEPQQRFYDNLVLGVHTCFLCTFRWFHDVRTIKNDIITWRYTRLLSSVPQPLEKKVTSPAPISINISPPPHAADIHHLDVL